METSKKKCKSYIFKTQPFTLKLFGFARIINPFADNCHRLFQDQANLRQNKKQMNKNLLIFLWLFLFAVSSHAQSCNLAVTFQKQMVLCNGQCTGSATANVTGAISPVSYLWSNGATTQTATQLCAGPITLTVSDVACTLEVTTSIPTRGKMGHSDYQISTSCFGACDGKDSLKVMGGTPPYSYLWNTGATTAVISGLCAGTYSVTTTDVYGCQHFCRHHVVSDPPLLVAFATSTNATCFGVCNGSVTVNASGGTPPYSYTYSFGAGTASQSGLCAGTYNITVTDAHGCTTVASTVVQEPPLLVPSVSVNFNFGPIGAMTASATGGTPPYSYLWSNGATTKSISGLSAGTYTVTVTDSLGCNGNTTARGTINIWNCNLSLSTQKQFIKCYGECTGSASVIATGGLGNITYAWSNGATSSSINQLCLGLYTVIVTDQANCSQTTTVNITQKGPLGHSHRTLSTSCFGVCDGTDSIHEMGGTPPYQYLWNTGATTQIVTGLCAATYSVTITDSYGCEDHCIHIVNSPLPLLATATGTTVCTGSCNGSVTIHATGGTKPYTYTWATGAGDSTATGLCSGLYHVLVTDAHGCSTTIDQAVGEINPNDNNECTIDACDPLTLSVSHTPVNTNDNNVCTTDACDPVTGVSHTLVNTNDNNVCTTDACNPVTGVSHTLVNTNDNNACTTDACDPLTGVSHSPVVADDNNLCTSDACDPLTGISHTPVNINDNNICTTDACDAVTGVSHTAVNINDNNPCTVDACDPLSGITHISNPPPGCLITGSNSCCAGGSVQLCAPAGLAGYIWSTGATTQCITVNNTGNYTVTVTNSNGCSNTCNKYVTVNQPPSCTITGGNICWGSGSTQLCAPSGQASYLWSTGATTQCINVCWIGNYTVTVTNASGCSSTCSKCVTLSYPPCVIITGNSAICSGGSTQLCGNAGLSSYLWSTGATTQCITVTTAGNYTLTASNGGCSSTATKCVTIGQPPVCNITTSTCNNNNYSYCGGYNGCNNNYGWWNNNNWNNCNNNNNYSNNNITQLCAGNGNWNSYLWSTGATTQCINVSSGTYTVTVTNCYGCSSSCSYTVAPPAPVYWGCTLGFWKNHTSLWDNPNAAIPQCLASAISAKGYSGNGTIGSSFKTTFGLTTTQMTNAGLSTNLTLLGALNLGGGNGNKLARQGTAALLNTCGLNGHYTYSASQVLNNIHNALANNTPEPLATQLGDANEVQPDKCPGNGNRISMTGVDVDDKITATAYPNPFKSEVTIQFTFATAMPSVVVEVFNANGSLVSTLFNGSANADELYQLKFKGDHLPQGVYIYRINTTDRIYYNKLLLMK